MTTTIASPRELRDARIRAGLTLKQISLRTEIGDYLISKIETGKASLERSRIESWQIQAWARMIGISPSRMVPDLPPAAETPLRRFRVRRHITLRQLSKITGIEANLLQRYESGKNEAAGMQSRMILTLADLYGTTIEHLLSRPECTRKVEAPPADWDGTALRWYRQQAGVSQARLSIMSGRTVQWIGAIERGDRWRPGNVKIGAMADIASALDIPVRMLLWDLWRDKGKPAADATAGEGRD